MEEKKMEDFIVPVVFEVKKVEYFSNLMGDSNGVAGPGFNSWPTGIIPYANFKVGDLLVKYLEGYDFKNPKDTGISEIDFYGAISGIENGDAILAYIHKYNLKEGKDTGLILSGKKSHYIIHSERPFREKEIVSRIELLGPGPAHNIKATFNGVDDFLKKDDSKVF